MVEPYPLLCTRRISRRLWGGNQLAGYLGIEDEDGGEPIAEAWQVYEGNLVLNGHYRDMTLAQVAAREGEAFLGNASAKRYGNKFPLLAKFIDAARPLSIQVHPDDEYARREEAGSGHLGKAEAWYILAASPGAYIYWGFRDTVSEARVRDAVIRGDLEDLVNGLVVTPGEVVYNPEGTVHAIGAGLFLFEIQQASDLTYRLYDYGRTDASGRERELHLDKALAVANLEGGSRAKVPPIELGRGRRQLVASHHFVMEGIEPDARLELTTSLASLELLTVTRGRLRLTHGATVTELPAGTSAVLPASLGGYLLEGEGEVLRCYVPEA